MDLSLDLIKADIVASAKMIADYKSTKSKASKNISAYHLQQAVEKLIKYQIYQNSNVYNQRNMYTHNISALIRYAQSIGVMIYIPPLIASKAILITSWEASSRYDYAFSVRIDSLERIQSSVETWFEYLAN